MDANISSITRAVSSAYYHDQRPGVVVRTVAVVAPRHGESSVLVNAGVVRESFEVIQTEFRKIKRAFTEPFPSPHRVWIADPFLLHADEQVQVAGGDLRPAHPARWLQLCRRWHG